MNAGELFIGIVAGAVIGVGGSIFAFNSQIVKLQSSYETLERRVVVLESTPQGTINTAYPVSGKGSDDVIFSDYFTGKGLGWPIVNEKDKQKIIANGKYKFMVPSGPKLYWAYKEIPGLPKNYDVIVEAQWISGVKDNDFGLVLGWDDKNNYFFGLTSEGYFQSHLRREGTYATPPMISRNLLGINSRDIVIRLAMRGKKVTVYVNEQVVGTAILNDFDLRNVGMYVDPGQTVEFDSLIIRNSG